MNTILAILATVFALIGASPGCQKDASLKYDPFDLFPPTRYWRHIAKTITRPQQIDKYVHFYLAPFRLIQQAERNRKLHLDVIQKSLLKALELSIRTADELRLTKKEYEGRKKEDYSAATRRALTILEGSEAKKLGPVLSAKVMRRFMLQRMDDMLWGTQKYQQMQSEKRRFIRNTKRLYRKIQKAPLYLMRHVVKKTVDLNEVQRSLAHDLRRFHHNKETAKGRTMDQLVWKIKGVGDDAAHSKPAIFWMTMTALLIGVTMIL